MKTVRSTDFQNSPGRYQDMARAEPIIITKHNNPSLVLLSFEDYQKLTKGDQGILPPPDPFNQNPVPIAKQDLVPAIKSDIQPEAAQDAPPVLPEKTAENDAGRKGMGHASRAAEGRTAWAIAWKAAWDAADHAANNENRNSGASAGRRAWAAAMVAARAAPPPAASDAGLNGQWTAAWNSAWAAAWTAAIAAAKVKLEERSERSAFPARAWNAKSREERTMTGAVAGCAAWNETYRSEIKKS